MKRFVVHFISILLSFPMLAWAQNKGNTQSLEIQFLKTKEAVQRLAPQAATASVSEVVSTLGEANKKIDAKTISQGGFDSGGGTLIRTSEGTGLLDLYLYNRDAFTSTQKGSTLPESRAFKSFGFDQVQSNNIRIVSKVLSQLQKWSASSPVMAAQIAKAIQSLPIFYTESRIGINTQSPFIPSDAKISQRQLKLVALYVNEIGVFIEKKTFDVLSERNQMALLIHEALRHEQISWASGLSNENLQRLTAEVLRDPTPGITLDRIEFMQGRVLDAYLLRLKSSAIGYEAIAELCSHIEKYCSYKNRTGLSSDQWADLISNGGLELLALRKELAPGSEKDRIFKAERLAMRAADTLWAQSLTEAWQSDESRNAVFRLRKAFNVGTIEYALVDYNKGAGYFSDSSRAVRKFVQTLKSEGFFQ